MHSDPEKSSTAEALYYRQTSQTPTLLERGCEMVLVPLEIYVLPVRRIKSLNIRKFQWFTTLKARWQVVNH